MKKRVKIFIDVVMTVLLILLFPTAKANPTLHVYLGIAFIGVAAIHLVLNGKWLLATTKKLFSGKLNPKTRYMYLLVVGLTIGFVICNYTGFVVWLSEFYTPEASVARLLDNSLHGAYRMHSVSAIICVVLTFLHAKVHGGYLKSAFSKKGEVKKSGVQA